MHSSRLAIALAFSLAACGGGGSHNPDAPGDDDTPDAHPRADARVDADFSPPVLYHPLPSLDDNTVAIMALQKLGAPVTGADNRCNNCHALTNAHLHQWGTYSAPAYPCLSNVDLTSPTSSAAALDCVRALSDSGVLETRALGVWAAAGRLDWFAQVFRNVYYPSNAEYTDFLAHVAMPPTIATTMDQSEFDVVAEWFVRGQPLLDELVPVIGPTDCTPTIGPEVSPLVTDLATTGWRAVNETNLLSMYGCAGAATTLDCMNDQPTPADRAYATSWEVAPGTMRILSEMPGYTSSYWTRSSADGRFVAQGGGDGAGGSTIIDLLDDHHIGVDAAYDPGFFPDNTGFVFQGFSSHNICAQSILLGHPTSISMATNPKCNGTTIGLYQHLGRRVGSDYFAISGDFVSDNGGFGEDPWAYFGAGESAQILPMVFDGNNYTQHTATSIPLDFEGDAVISPSTRMMITRQGDASGKQTAYILHAINATPSGSTYVIDAPQIGSYCGSGGKPAFSYDERWVVYHHVLDPNSDADAIDLGYADHFDPGYQPYRTQGASNIYLMDLLNGARVRITHMGPGQFAYFPHFRSDGWIYFLERDSSRETIVGTDYALRIE